LHTSRKKIQDPGADNPGKRRLKGEKFIYENGHRCASSDVESLTPLYQNSAEIGNFDVHPGPTAIHALGLIAQTVRRDGPNVKATWCASVRKEQVTLRLGRKR
jgi:hypothetical protein